MVTSEASSFGTRLRALRDAAGLSRRELAEKAGVGHQSIVNWETGLRDPAWSAVVALAAALGVECTAFLENEPEEPQGD